MAAEAAGRGTNVSSPALDDARAGSWIRATDEPCERRLPDVAVLIGAVVGAAVIGVWAQAESTIDIDLFRPINDLTSNIEGLGKAVYALGSIWMVVAVAAAFLLLGKRTLVVRVLLAGGIAWGVAKGLNSLLGPHAVQSLHIHIRSGSGPSFPANHVAVIAALAFTLAPFLVRPARWLSAVVVLAVATATMYLGAGFASDTVGGAVLGLAAAAAVLVLLGSPAGHLTIDELGGALTDLGLDVADIHYSDTTIARATVTDVRLTTGEHYTVQAFGRDQRDARLVAKAWHWLMYKDPSQPVFGSRVQQVEHMAYTMMLGERAGANVPSVVRIGLGGEDAAILITDEPRGAPLASIPDRRLTDRLLARVWDQVTRLHDAEVAHGNLDLSRIVVGDRGAVALIDFSLATATGQSRDFDQDVAAVLVATALRVGDDRAISAAVAALGKERLASAVPLLQPAALPADAGRGEKHFGRHLKALTTATAAAAGVEDVKPLKIRRLSWGTILLTACLLLAVGLTIPTMAQVNFSSLKSEFEQAAWGFVVAAALVYPLILCSYATVLIGCVNVELPLVPTLMLQLAASLLNLITPNGIGGTALQVDYLRKADVSVASTASTLVLSGSVTYVLQLVILFAAAALTSSQLNLFHDPSGGALVIIALVAAAIGALLLFPKLRGRAVPQVKRAVTDVWTVLRTPRKAVRIFGGGFAAVLLGPAVLGLCLLAFGQSLGFAQLIVVQMGASFLASITPVPGGIGVQEAALTGALTGFGVPSAPALAAVLVYRALTFALPPCIGFFSLRWMRKEGYV